MSKIARTVLVVTLALGTILLIVAITIPSLGGMYDRAEVTKLIANLDAFKAARGNYPKNLEPSGVTDAFCHDGTRGIDYRVENEGTEFTLTCFGRGPVFFSPKWEIYSSETGSWKGMDR